MSGLHWPVAATIVSMPGGHSLVCGKLAPVRTKVIEAGLTVVVPGMFESPALPAPSMSNAFATLMLALRAWPVCTSA